MPIVGGQDVWRTGARVYVIEDPIDSSPLLDLGTIQVVSPANQVEDVRLEDSDGGLKRLVAREVAKFEEKYQIQLFNLNMKNLRYLFYGESVQTFSQTVGTFFGGVASGAFINNVSQASPSPLGELLKLRTASVAPYEYQYMIAEFGALGLNPEYTITAVTATTFSAAIPGAVVGTARFAVGDRIRVFGNATAAANTDYIVTAVSTGTTPLVLTVQNLSGIASTNGATVSGRFAHISTSLPNVLDFALNATSMSTTTLCIAGDWTDQFTAGRRVFVYGNTTAAVNNTQAGLAPTTPVGNQVVNSAGNFYTVASSSFGAGTTTITVNTMPGTPTVSTGRVSLCVVLNQDYTVPDFERGIVRISTNSVLLQPGQVVRPIYTVSAIASGLRLMRPQTRQGVFEGNVLVEWARGNFAQRTVREFRGSITPGAGAFSDSEFSTFPLDIEVLNDVTSLTNPAGRLLAYKGPLPTQS